MRTMLLCGLFVFAVALHASAGPVREIELTDGSTITGEVQSLTGGMYTIKTDSLGTLKIEESKVRTIRQRPSGAPNSAQGSKPASGEIKTLQEKMLTDAEVMGLIQSLQNDPEFKKILEDPEIMKAVNAGDVAALAANPAFMKLLNNKTVREIGEKVK